MLCKNFSRFFGILAVPVITLFVCFGAFSIDAAAEIEITKVSAFTGRSFFGDTIPAKYYLNGAATSFNFEYYNSYSSPGVGLNVESSSIIPTPVGMAQYDFVVYRGILPTFDATYDISIDDFYLRFGDYARGGFALSWRGSSETVAWNNAINYPDNYCGGFSAVRANSDASANLADYYGIMYFEQQNGYVFKYRPIYYSFDSGGVLDSLNFSGITPNAAPGTTNGLVYLVIICPYIGSSMSGEPPAQTTTTTDISSSGGVTIINNNTDLTETNGLLGSIISAISGVVESIINGIKNIFVPSDEFMEDFGDELDAIKARFEWSEEIKDIGADFKDILQNQENASAPVVVLPSITNSKDGTVYTSGGENVLDLGEFETEVIIVRGILAVLLWVFFLWRLYARLPDIIHGSGMIVGDGNRIMNELDERQSQAVFNDIETHANSIFQGTMPDITYIDNPDKVDWKV